MDTRIQ
ncbi:addiction module toxin, RelE/StbE family protein, partial [Vibrio parahaemolyticus V-223/04]